MLDLLALITKKLDTVNELLEVGEITRLSGTMIKSKDAILTTIFDTDECLVGVGRYERVGDSTPTHKHDGVTQYLIQYKGKCSVDFENGAYRVIEAGECVKLRPNELHKVTALTNEAEQLFICIPAEKGYRIIKDLLIDESLGRKL
jgi:quercetin dioxygenase-like cupin family protein